MEMNLQRQPNVSNHLFVFIRFLPSSLGCRSGNFLPTTCRQALGAGCTAFRSANLAQRRHNTANLILARLKHRLIVLGVASGNVADYLGKLNRIRRSFGSRLRHTPVWHKAGCLNRSRTVKRDHYPISTAVSLEHAASFPGSASPDTRVAGSGKRHTLLFGSLNPPSSRAFLRIDSSHSLK